MIGRRQCCHLVPVSCVLEEEELDLFRNLRHATRDQSTRQGRERGPHGGHIPG